MKLIQYVGYKPAKADTVARTGLTWTPGQVHVVADEAAAKLLGFPSVWKEAPHEKAEAEAEAEAEAVLNIVPVKKLRPLRTVNAK
jgi:hypothetical protein